MSARKPKAGGDTVTRVTDPTIARIRRVKDEATKKRAALRAVEKAQDRVRAADAAIVAILEEAPEGAERAFLRSVAEATLIEGGVA